MNWNTTYHIYEGIALLWIMITWGSIAFKTAPAYDADLQSINGTLKQILSNEDQKHCNWLENLCIDVDRQGNSREGLDRIKRANELENRLNRVHTKIRNTRKQIEQTQSVTNTVLTPEKAQQIAQLLNTQVSWMNTEFKDLSLKHPFEHIVKTDHLTHFTNTTKTAAQSLLLTYQLQLKEYESEVLRKLGAQDFSFSYGCGFTGPSVISPSNTIQVGDDYIAEIFDNHQFQRIFSLKYFVNNQLLTDRYESFKFKTQGVGRKHFNITVQYRTSPFGRLKSVEKNIPYTVLPK
ncbi:MAG TPA: hypothetical protein DCS93_06510 [Microscillaceae bacterium]|nr:hypothetical protein [Microscillaceae bacterium]